MSNKTNVGVKIGLVLVAFLLILTTATALTIEGAKSYDLCQCSTEKQLYTVCADLTGNYNVSLSGTAAKWFSIAPTSLYIEEGDCETFFMFITPECYATSGIYSVTLNVDGPEKESKSIGVSVQQCHTFDYTISPSKNTSAPCEDNSYNLYIKNTGKFVDEFVLIQDGLTDSWITYPNEKFVLKAGEEFSSVIKVKSTCSTKADSYPFTMTLSNTLTNSSKTIDLTQKITSKNVVETTFSNDSINLESCSVTDTNYSFYVKNISTVTDEYTLEISDKEILSLDKTKITLKPQESTQVTLKVNATKVANLEPVLSITSKEYALTQKESFDLEIKNCYDLSLERISTSEQSCFNSSEHLFRLTNNGSKSVTAKITVSGIESESKEVSVGAKSSRDFYLTFDPKTFGEKKITITAEAVGLSSTKLNMDFEVKNCYDIEVKVPLVEVCPETDARNKIIFTNKGTEDQTVNINMSDAVWVKFESQKVIVPAGESVEVYFDMEVPSTINEKYLLNLISYSPGLDGDIVKAVLRQSDISTEMYFKMNDLNECYSFEAKYLQKYLDINCCQGKVVDLNITNTGFFKQKFSLKRIAPEWVDFSDTDISIESGETKTLYVYFHPPAGTSGQIKSTIEIKNRNGITKNVEFDLNVFGGHCGLSYDVNLGVENNVSTTKEFTRKEITVDFVVKNDSNFGFTINDIAVKDFNSQVDYQKGVFLQPGESTTTKITIMFSEDQIIEDKEVTVLVNTSVGVFEKKQFVKFSEAKTADYSISGLFGQYVAPVAGLVLLLVLLVIILVISGSTKGKKK